MKKVSFFTYPCRFLHLSLPNLILSASLFCEILHAQHYDGGGHMDNILRARYYDDGSDMAGFLRARYYDGCGDTTAIIRTPNTDDGVQMPAILGACLDLKGTTDIN